MELVTVTVVPTVWLRAGHVKIFSQHRVELCCSARIPAGSRCGAVYVAQ
jgi:hypothetical protein